MTLCRSDWQLYQVSVLKDWYTSRPPGCHDVYSYPEGRDTVMSNSNFEAAHGRPVTAYACQAPHAGRRRGWTHMNGHACSV